MAIVAIFEAPGMTQAEYEQSLDRLTGGGTLNSPEDWPVPGIISHTAAPTPDGWLVVDVWESEEAFQRFAEIIVPIHQDIGGKGAEPKVYPVFKVVTAPTD